MARTVFYAWQSDSPSLTNRNLIESALKKALQTISADIQVETVIDRNADGVAGIPDIPSTIYTKIENADAFVCDISIVSSRRARRPTPNPNVLIELGYAMHALGENRIVMVLNRVYGDISRLPFDLDKRRVIGYLLDSQAEEEARANERTRLEGALKNALRAILIIAQEIRQRESRIQLAWEVDQNRNRLVVLMRTLDDANTRTQEQLSFLESLPLEADVSIHAWTDARIRLSAGLTEKEQATIADFHSRIDIIQQRIAHIVQAQKELREARLYYRSQHGGVLGETSPGSAAARARHDFVALVHNTLIPQLRQDIKGALALGNPLIGSAG